jgi:hypothetical protein
MKHKTQNIKQAITVEKWKNSIPLQPPKARELRWFHGCVHLTIDCNVKSFKPLSK